MTCWTAKQLPLILVLANSIGASPNCSPSQLTTFTHNEVTNLWPQEGSRLHSIEKLFPLAEMSETSVSALTPKWYYCGLTFINLTLTYFLGEGAFWPELALHLQLRKTLNLTFTEWHSSMSPLGTWWIYIQMLHNMKQQQWILGILKGFRECSESVRNSKQVKGKTRNRHIFWVKSFFS